MAPLIVATPLKEKTLPQNIQCFTEEVPLEQQTPTSTLFSLLKDLFQLTKPRLSSLVIFTMSTGIFLGEGSLSFSASVVAILATFGIIGASNTFNMVLDRNIDTLMDRTKSRPIPSGRLSSTLALQFGFVLLALSLPALYVSSNLLTASLGALACFLYSCVYTPLKVKTPLAVYIGAIPGAMPMLMGYTATTNQITGFGLSLFAILLVWQIPHFLAIALNLAPDYQKANVQVYPVAIGLPKTRYLLVLFSGIFWGTTFLPLFFSPAGWLYATLVNLLGVLFLWGSFLCLKSSKYERPYFLGTLLYLPALLLTLIFEVHYLNRIF